MNPCHRVQSLLCNRYLNCLIIINLVVWDMTALASCDKVLNRIVRDYTGLVVMLGHVLLRYQAAIRSSPAPDAQGAGHSVLPAFVCARKHSGSKGLETNMSSSGAPRAQVSHRCRHDVMVPCALHRCCQKCSTRSSTGPLWRPCRPSCSGCASPTSIWPSSPGRQQARPSPLALHRTRALAIRPLSASSTILFKLSQELAQFWSESQCIRYRARS